LSVNLSTTTFIPTIQRSSGDYSLLRIRPYGHRMPSDWIKRSSNRWPNRNTKLAFPVNFKPALTGGDVTKALMAKVAVVALAAGVLGLSGTTVAAAAPAGQAAPRNAALCEGYLRELGYVVGPKVKGACDTAAGGFPAICEVLLVDAGVTDVNARYACAFGAA
jgi:hypothetical protein